MNEYTKEPWAWSEGWLVADPYKVIISPDDGVRDGDDSANGELIAKAPQTARQRDDLLAVCKRLVSRTVGYACSVCPDYPTEGECDVSDCTVVQARAAIDNVEKREE